MIAMDIYTVSPNAKPVKVADFRNAIDHLERLVHVDFVACVGQREREQWVERARRTGRDLISITCKRAKADDWDRRERAIDTSTKMIGRVVAP